MLKELKFPVQIAMPYRLTCLNKANFLELVNLYNGKKNLFFSVYSCSPRGTFESVQVDKIAFDFDEADAIEDVRKLHKYCMDKNIRHCMMYSGKKGFHVYIFCKNYESLMNPKVALDNAHGFFIGELDLMMDMHIKGDIARVMRLPGTWHLSGKRFCTSITEQVLEQGIDYIRNIAAKRQSFEIITYGTQHVNIKHFDTAKKKSDFADLIEYEGEITIDDKFIDKNFPACVKAWLNNMEHPEHHTAMGTYEARYYFAVFCNAIGLTRQACDGIAQRYFSKAPRHDRFKNNYNHFKRHNVIDYAYKDDVFFPNVQTLNEKGLFIGKKPDKDDFGLYD